MNSDNQGIKSDSKPKELVGIQHLRGIAALLVVLTHIDGMARFPKYFNISIPGLLGSGAIGVHLFFLISGFIIPYVSLKQNSLLPEMSASTFLRRRFIRIIPFMWACVIGYAMLRFVGRGTFPVIPYLRALTLFPVGEVNPEPVWTLRHEFLFYTIFCVALLYSKRQQWIAMAFWFLSPFLWYLVTANVDLQSDSFLYELCTFVFSKLNIFFGIGFLAGVFHMKGYQWTWVSRHGFLVSLLSTLPLVVVADFLLTDTKFMAFGPTIVLGIFALGSLFVGVTLQTPKPLSLIDKVGLKLGDASYSIYLTHTAFVSAILGIWSKILPSTHLVLIILVGTLLAVLGGIVVHTFIEKPLIKLTQKVLNPKPKVMQPAPAIGVGGKKG
jgi:exopolysaccharide production protein ExoZ